MGTTAGRCVERSRRDFSEARNLWKKVGRKRGLEGVLSRMGTLYVLHLSRATSIGRERGLTRLVAIEAPKALALPPPRALDADTEWGHRHTVNSLVGY